MKKILLITPFIPSKIGAGVNYSRQLINDLAIDNKVDLVMFKYCGEDECIVENENVSVVKIFKNSMFLKILNILLFPFLHPLFVVRFNFIRLFFIKRLVRTNNYDLLYLDFSQTFLYGKFIHNLPKVLMSHDVITQRYSRLNNIFLEKLCKASENFVLNSSDSKVFCFSEKDCELMKLYFNKDASATCFYLESQIIESQPKKLEEVYVLFAMWKRKDNLDGLLWFLSEVYPSLNNDCKFKIIGGGLDPKLIEAYKNIEYLGFVDNPYPMISNSKALIAPLFTGAGVKVKVIDSLASGTSVIGTQVAFEGISKDFSSYMIEANTKSEFIERINNFKTDLENKINFKSYFLETYPQLGVVNYINSRFNKL